MMDELVSNDDFIYDIVIEYYLGSSFGSNLARDPIEMLLILICNT